VCFRAGNIRPVLPETKCDLENLIRLRARGMRSPVARLV
jgi:hypothetical protein